LTNTVWSGESTPNATVPEWTRAPGATVSAVLLKFGDQNQSPAGVYCLSMMFLQPARLFPNARQF